MKRFLFILVLACVLAVILLFRSCQDGEDNTTLPTASLAQQANLAELGPLGLIRRQNANQHSLMFVDLVTGTPINPSNIAFLGVEINGGLSAPIPAQSLTPDDAEFLSGVWAYSRVSTDGEVRFNVPLDKELGFEKPIPLPWTSSVVFVPLSQTANTVHAGVAEIAFPSEEDWAKVMSGQVPGEDVFSPSRSMATKLNIYDDNFEDLVWTELAEVDNAYQVKELPFGGIGLIKFQHPDYGTSTHWVDMSYGEVSFLEQPLRVRPVFKGQVVDQSGNGVGNAKVLMNVHLDPEASEASLLPTDGDHGRIAFGTEGNYSYLIKRGIKTDDDGFFSVDCPAGLAFALEAYSADRKAYAIHEVTSYSPGVPNAPIELVLVQNQAWGPTIKCLGPDGDEVYGIEISFMIAGDYWARAFPTCKTDEGLTTRFPWLPNQPATLGIRMKRHPEWEKASGVFLVEYSGNRDSTIIINLEPKFEH